jgi:hypothetical protein
MDAEPAAFEVRTSPPLLVISKTHLRPEQAARIDEALNAAFADPARRALVFEPGLTVFQWVGGRYARLDEPAPRPRLLSRIAAVFRP